MVLHIRTHQPRTKRPCTTFSFTDVDQDRFVPQDPRKGHHPSTDHPSMCPFLFVSLTTNFDLRS